MKKNNKQIFKTGAWIIVTLIAIGVFYYMGSQGFFKGGDFNNYPPAPSERLPELDNGIPNVECSLSIVPSSIVSGSSFSVNLQDGINSECNIYITNGSEWREFYAGRTDIDGKLTRTFTILAVGNYRARAICGECITNYGDLTINPKPIEPSKTCSQLADEQNSYYKEPCSSSANCMYIANTECNKVGKISSWTSQQGTCCLFKCIDQPPVPPSNPTCTDADGGLNYNLAGDCRVGDSVLAHESCIDGTLLTERQCMNNICQASVYECPNGCLNGACITSPADDPALIACANHCMDIGYHGATTHVSSAGACWTDTVSICRMEFGLDAEASTYADNCCCQECVGW